MVLLKIENKSSAVRLIKELRQTNWKRLQNEENLVFFLKKKKKISKISERLSISKLRDETKVVLRVIVDFFY